MTAYAWCGQCHYAFTTHAAHPQVPAHMNYGTGNLCTGVGSLALVGVGR